MYLNAGVSLLCVAGTETRDLAPPNLYAADTLEATKNALVALASEERERLANEAGNALPPLVAKLVEYLRPLKNVGNKDYNDAVKFFGGTTFDAKNKDHRDKLRYLVVYLESIVDFESPVKDEIEKLMAEKSKTEAELQKLKKDVQQANKEADGVVERLREAAEAAEEDEESEEYESAYELDDDGGVLVDSAVKFVRMADLLEQHAARRANTMGSFALDIEEREKQTRVSQIPNDVNPLFVEEAIDAVRTSGSLKKTLQNSDGLSKYAKELLCRTSASRRVAQMDRLLARASTGAECPPVDSYTCAINIFMKHAHQYLDAVEFENSEYTVKQKVEGLLPSGKAEERRAGIWNEMLKDAALATDRLWIFVRTLSGLIGEDAESILESADDDTIRASKEADKRRSEIAETVSKFQAKLIETLVGGLVKESKLQLTTPKDAADQLVVVDSETAQQIRDLASGESGRPFFEANVALRNLQESSKGQPRRLSELIGEFGEVSKALHASLVEELKVGEGVAGSTLSNLSKPANSYFVKLRDDTSAAIRAAYDRFLVEYELKVGGRRVKLWELIEGADNLLSTRFAELCGHVLVQNRLSTSVSAMYVGRNQAAVNAAQAHVSLARLINQAASYASRVPAADWKGNDVVGQRNRYFENARDKVDTWASGAGGAYAPARSLFTKSVVSTYGPRAWALQY